MARVAGLDWAAYKHDVRVCDTQTGEVLLEETVIHSEDGISGLCAQLIALGVCRVAIERPDGLLVARLVDAGVPVMAIHPNQVAAARPRFRAAAGKSDRFDAMVLCELARTDSHRFKLLRRDSDHVLALRALTRAREDLVGTRVKLANQLRAELDRYWPGAARLFSKIDTPISLAFIERYPTPVDAVGLGPKRMAGFLARHEYCGRTRPDTFIARLRQAPEGRAGEIETEARRLVVIALVNALKPLVDQIRRLTREIAHLLDTHPDGPIFRSFFKDPKSIVCAAVLLAEIGDQRDRYPTPDTLAADAGMAAVAVESGKHRHAAFRRACDHRLRAAMATMADSTRHWHPIAQDRYQAARARGHDHPRAIRTVGRCWTRVLWRCWHDHQPYNPERHGSIQRLKG